MTMEFKGFSMREYTSRMRSVNVVKCWPFDETDEDAVKSLLPPITVKKFTWWFDALELSQNVVVEENSKNKGKQRAPKKRSIKELFAVAPPVDRVSSEDEDDDEQELRDSKEIKWGLKGKRNEKKKKKNSKEVLLSKLKKPKKKINKLKKKMDLPVANKEICFKLHLESHGVVNKLDIDISEAIPLNKAKTKANEKKKSIAQKSSKVTVEDEDSEFPIRGILKNQSRNRILEEEQSNPCRDKHVSFSDKNHVLECQELLQHLHDSPDSDDRAGERRSSTSNVIVTSRSETERDVARALGKNQLSMECYAFDMYNLVKERSQERHFATSIASYQQGQEHVQNINAYGRLFDNLGDPNPRLPPFCLKAYNEPFPRLSPKELLGTLCSPREVNQKRPDGDFIGLPLNSQGELIKLNSRGISEFHPMINPSNIASTSSVNLALNQLPVCTNKNPVAFMPSRFGITESQHVGKTVEWDPHPRIESYYDRDHVFPHLVQSKMRLMGKEFLVGGNELWKDKHIVTYEHQRVDGLTFYSQSEPSLGKLGETSINPVTYSPRPMARDPELTIPRPGFHGLSHAPRSIIRFPFMHPDLGAHEQPSWSNNATPLLFDVAQNEGLLSYGHSMVGRSNLGGCFGLSSMAGPTSLPNPQVNEGFCLHNSFTPVSTFQNSIRPAQMNHHGLGPCYSGIMPSSVLKQGSKMTFEEPMRSGMTVRGPSHGKRPKKRALGLSDNSLKPVKRPNFRSQEPSNMELDFAKNKTKILAREDSMARSGPVKLSAGGKHILKACQKMDQSSFNSTQSTGPFEATMSGFRLLESEKSGQIYRI